VQPKRDRLEKAAGSKNKAPGRSSKKFLHEVVKSATSCFPAVASIVYQSQGQRLRIGGNPDEKQQRWDGRYFTNELALLRREFFVLRSSVKRKGDV